MAEEKEGQPVRVGRGMSEGSRRHRAPAFTAEHRPAWQFQPGTSGNPGGQSKQVGRQLREMLELPIPEPLRQELNKSRHGRRGLDLPPDATFQDALVTRLIVGALLGDYRYVRELLDRTMGKSPVLSYSITEKVKPSNSGRIALAKLLGMSDAVVHTLENAPDDAETNKQLDALIRKENDAAPIEDPPNESTPQ
jgi:Family of unknown function (DUF5681)